MIAKNDGSCIQIIATSKWWERRINCTELKAIPWGDSLDAYVFHLSLQCTCSPPHCLYGLSLTHASLVRQISVHSTTCLFLSQDTMHVPPGCQAVATTAFLEMKTKTPNNYRWSHHSSRTTSRYQISIKYSPLVQDVASRT